MTSKQIKPYGSWKSPITSELITSASVGLDQIRLGGGSVFWTELRPNEGGRVVIVERKPDGSTVDRTPPPFNARTRTHEYGGASFQVEEGTIYFSNFYDQQLYRQTGKTAPEQLTHTPDMRYADGVIDTGSNRMICIREDHSQKGIEAENTIASVDLETGDVTVLESGNDFYAAPRLSPDGTKFAWISWQHPNMPWDASEVWTADVENDGSLINKEKIAGSGTESVFQPEWSPDGGILYFVSDRTGWWNLYRYSDGDTEALWTMEAEFGMPQWVFGMRTYAFESASQIVCSYTVEGVWYLASLDTQSLKTKVFDIPFTEISDVQAADNTAVIWGGSPTQTAAIVTLDLSTGAFEILRKSNDLDIDPGYISQPQSVEFPTSRNRTAHAIYYPPQNKDFDAPSGERPPLIVKSHGGPTSAAHTTLNLRIQYWTSRGFGVIDVNYGGSTGYGREYRERLKGQWGIVDVEDCVNAARFLVEREEADGKRLAITGGSAGGYTTLCALTFHDVFSAGASHYGVSDLEALALDTHKFESQYLVGLIGLYPEEKEIYRERSPIHFTEDLSCPLIVFQGLEDKVVPPNQAEKIVDAVRRKGLPVAYVPFEGEQHGFRKAENIKRSLDGELDFYSRIFGFEPAEPVEPVSIENIA